MPLHDTVNEEFLQYMVATFSFSLVATLLLMPLLIQLASRLGLMDEPNRRKIHRIPKPLIGGIAMMISFVIGTPLFINSQNLRGLFAGILLLVLMGCLDDFREIDHRLKLIVQVLASLLIIYLSNIKLYAFGNLLALGRLQFMPIAVPVTVFSIVGVINALNMIDGLDGLAGGLSLLGFVAFGTLAWINGQPDLLLICLLMSGALLGFLKYNWHPAKVFMGDAGSLTIGFILAFLSIAITQKSGGKVAPIAALLVLAVPIVDTLTVITIRWLKGRSLFQPDRNHIHHILLKLGFNKRNAVGIILCLCLIMTSVAVIGTFCAVPDYMLFALFLSYFIIYGFIATHIKRILIVKSCLKEREFNCTETNTLLIKTAKLLSRVTN